MYPADKAGLAHRAVDPQKTYRGIAGGATPGTALIQPSINEVSAGDRQPSPLIVSKGPDEDRLVPAQRAPVGGGSGGAGSDPDPTISNPAGMYSAVIDHWGPGPRKMLGDRIAETLGFKIHRQDAQNVAEQLAIPECDSVRDCIGRLSQHESDLRIANNALQSLPGQIRSIDGRLNLNPNQPSLSADRLQLVGYLSEAGPRAEAARAGIARERRALEEQILPKVAHLHTAASNFANQSLIQNRAAICQALGSDSPRDWVRAVVQAGIVSSSAEATTEPLNALAMLTRELGKLNELDPSAPMSVASAESAAAPVDPIVIGVHAQVVEALAETWVRAQRLTNHGYYLGVALQDGAFLANACNRAAAARIVDAVLADPEFDVSGTSAVAALLRVDQAELGTAPATKAPPFRSPRMRELSFQESLMRRATGTDPFTIEGQRQRTMLGQLWAVSGATTHAEHAARLFRTDLLADAVGDSSKWLSLLKDALQVGEAHCSPKALIRFISANCTDVAIPTENVTINAEYAAQWLSYLEQQAAQAKRAPADQLTLFALVASQPGPVHHPNATSTKPLAVVSLHGLCVIDANNNWSFRQRVVDELKAYSASHDIILRIPENLNIDLWTTALNKGGLPFLLTGVAGALLREKRADLYLGPCPSEFLGFQTRGRFNTRGM